MANESGPNRPNRPLRPRQGAPGQRRKRRVVIDNAAARPQQPREVVPPTGPVTVESGVTVRDFSQALGVPMGELIKILMGLGQMRTATQSLSDEEVELIAAELKREVQIVVAVNKIDVADADPTRVRTELSGEGLQPEEWGGTTQFSDVSAKQGQNLDDLLERVLLVADAELELTANPNAEASGPIIESRLDIGRGPVATMLIHRGTLRVGDAVVAGDGWGKVRALHNFHGEKLN